MADKNTRPLLNVSKSILDTAYMALSQDWALWDSPIDAALRLITESISDTLHVARASIWILNAQNNGFMLLDLYDQKKNHHSNDTQLLFSDYPTYFDALSKGRIIDAVDAHADYRTREFSENYLIPNGIGSMLDATLRKTGQLYGVLCIEHVGGQRLWNEHEKRFAVSIADLISQRLIYRALREEEARYHILFESAGDSIFLMQGDRFIDCNQATLEIFGCTRDQIIGQTPQRYSPEFQLDGRLSSEKALKKITAAFRGAKQTFDWRHIKYDGTPFDAEVTLNMIEIRGQPHLLASVRDISARKKSQRELENSRQQLLSRNEILTLINELSDRLHASQSVDAIIHETLHSLLGLTNTPHVAIYLLDEDSRVLRLASNYGFDNNTVNIGSRLPLDNSLTGLALKEGHVMVSSDFADDGRLNQQVKAQLLKFGIISGVVIPLLYQQQHLGSINLVYTSHRVFSDIELETFEAIGKTVSLALANTRHMKKLEIMAHHDSLTGLANRALLHEHFSAVIKNNPEMPAALLLLDLDRFKEINDTLGHHIGDKLLQQIGPRISALHTAHYWLICRLGGDEFTVLIQDVSDKNELMDYAQSLLDSLKKPYSIDSMILEIDVSIGIAVYPADGNDSHALLRSADVAMYEAKGKGGGIAYYDPSADKHTPERLALIAELGTAIREGQLCLHYQPKVGLKTGKVTGFEALVRWQHPQMGLLYPDKFIHLAEVSDAIHHLSKTVLDSALRQQQRWRKDGYDFSVAINLSARNLIDERCVGFIEALLTQYQTPPGMLELEITETALMYDPDGAVALLNRLSQLGVKLSIDDFGTGYSSLSYLRRLPIDALKIDREFVTDMLENEQDSIIVRSTIALAHNLNLKVVAEGVEDETTLQALKMMGCDIAQGYFISKPNDPPTMEAWLENSPYKSR